MACVVVCVNGLDFSFPPNFSVLIFLRCAPKLFSTRNKEGYIFDIFAMAKKARKKPQTDKEYFEYFQQKRFTMTKTIVVISLLSMVCFGSLGYLIDMMFDTRPVGLIVLIVMSFPVTQIVIRKRLKNIIHD